MSTVVREVWETGLSEKYSSCNERMNCRVRKFHEATDYVKRKRGQFDFIAKGERCLTLNGQTATEENRRVSECLMPAEGKSTNC